MICYPQIYNEQIGDLLDPTQRNLEVETCYPLYFLDVSLVLDCNNGFRKKLFQISDDAKNGLYVENLTEEYVTSFEDVTQILIKVCNTF